MHSYLFIAVFIFSIFSGIACGYFNSKKPRLILFVIVAAIYFLSFIYAQSITQSKNFIPLTFIFLFQFFNLIRIMENRYELPNTRRRVTKTGLYFLIPVFLISLLNIDFLFNTFFIEIIIFSLGSILLVKTFKSKTSIISYPHISDNDLPTISVLIPARNEDSSLADCIESVVSSNYPKLEVLVLDDCSQDNSSEIIKSFAQKGVRFIQGEPPKDNWLAKNQAYETLANAASGDWYLFMGVDIRLGPNAIINAVYNAQKNNKDMVSIVPIVKGLGFRDIFVPLRVFWESTIPKFISKYPPVLSTCWLITDNQFKSLGGLAAVSQSVLPERYFANKISINNRYLYMTSQNDMVVESYKSYKDQLETSQRLLYPQIKKSYVNLLILSVFALYLTLQYWMIIKAVISGDYALALMPLVSLTPLLLSIYIISDRQEINHKLLRMLLLPYLIIQELMCLYISAYRYEFSEVIWKGRNVCYPTLKVIPRLPKI